MSKKKIGMSEKTYKHISENLHLLELDLTNGVVLNRKAKRLSRYGYPQVGLAYKIVHQHQIFAVARWGKACIGMTVNHINECRTDNSWDNLELLTHSDNLRAKKRPSGSCIPKQPIKAIHIDTGEIYLFNSVREASRKLGLNPNRISETLTGKRKYFRKYTFRRTS